VHQKKLLGCRKTIARKKKSFLKVSAVKDVHFRKKMSYYEQPSGPNYRILGSSHEFENFVNNNMSNNKPSMVLFSDMKNCGWCRKAEPEFDGAAADRQVGPYMAVVDAQHGDNGGFMESIGVEAFPTVRVYTPQGWEDYNGERTARAFVSGLKKTLRNSSY
jgi:hypothetical protein